MAGGGDRAGGGRAAGPRRGGPRGVARSPLRRHGGGGHGRRQRHADCGGGRRQGGGADEQRGGRTRMRLTPAHGGAPSARLAGRPPPSTGSVDAAAARRSSRLRHGGARAVVDAQARRRTGGGRRGDAAAHGWGSTWGRLHRPWGSTPRGGRLAETCGSDKGACWRGMSSSLPTPGRPPAGASAPRHWTIRLSAWRGGARRKEGHRKPCTSGVAAPPRLYWPTPLPRPSAWRGQQGATHTRRRVPRWAPAGGAPSCRGGARPGQGPPPSPSEPRRWGV